MSSHTVHVYLLSKLFVGDILSNSYFSKLFGRSSLVDANGVDENNDGSDVAEGYGFVFRISNYFIISCIYHSNDGGFPQTMQNMMLLTVASMSMMLIIDEDDQRRWR